MKSITFICQDELFGKSVSQGVADALDMYFADASEIISYSLQNENEIQKLCGLDYLYSLKEKCLNDMSEYENSIIFLNSLIYLGLKDKSGFLEKTDVFYIKIDKKMLEKVQKTQKNTEKEEKQLNLLQFENRDSLLKKYSKDVITLVNLGIKTAIKKIVKCVTGE